MYDTCETAGETQALAATATRRLQMCRAQLATEVLDIEPGFTQRGN